MNLFNLPPDDLPPQKLTVDDRQLRRQLELSLTQRFQEQCSPFVKQLLAECDWYVTTNASVVMLVIACPDAATNWEVLHYVPHLGAPMAQFSEDAKIRIYPPIGTGDPFEIRVDELPIYWD